MTETVVGATRSRKLYSELCHSRRDLDRVGENSQKDTLRKLSQVEMISSAKSEARKKDSQAL